jgi:transcriptional regulator with XRE-family HTH domain
VPRRKRDSPKLWNANQIVAFNVARARMLRGWTQEEAAEQLAPYLGVRMSGASFSAIERSVDAGRPREFDANELLAFARAFRVPLGWFFTPPTPWWDGVGIATPDASDEGLDPMVMLDAVLGTPETLEDYKSYLLSWPNPLQRMRRYDDGRLEYLGPEMEDVHPRLDEQLRLRTRTLLREHFGDIDRAQDFLRRLIALLDDLDEGDVEHSEVAPDARQESSETRSPDTSGT